MSLHGFRAALDMVKRDEPFYGIIMAAMLKADDVNKTYLKMIYPLVWAELEARYHAPGGLLPEEQEQLPEPPDGTKPL